MRARRDDDVNLETDEIGYKIREPLGSALGIAVLDDDVLTFDIV